MRNPPRNLAREKQLEDAFLKELIRNLETLPRGVAMKVPVPMCSCKIQRDKLFDRAKKVLQTAGWALTGKCNDSWTMRPSK